MLGKQGDNTDLFQCVTMEALVPPEHRLRRLMAVLDLSFVREQVASLYSPLGRTSIDPEVVVRMWILQHLHGYSERELCDEMQMHAGFRWFCGLSFNDPIPDQSTLVKLRTQKWAASGLWEQILRETLCACEQAGIAYTHRLGVDGTQILANAATVSLQEIPPTLSVVNSEYEDEPEGPSSCAAPEAPVALAIQEGGRPQGVRKTGDPDWHGVKFSNTTHRSTTDPTDPEARLSRKGEQEAKLRYMGHYLADLGSGVVYDAMATQATGVAERSAAIRMLDNLIKLEKRPHELVADKGYRDGSFLVSVIERGVTPLVPMGEEALEPEPVWRYLTKKPALRKKREHRIAVIRARNATRLGARSRHAANAQKQRTRLEHLFAEAKEHHGMARAQGRGLTRVDQQVKLTAAIQNLKRLLKHRPRRPAVAEAIALQVTSMPRFRSSTCVYRLHLRTRLRRTSTKQSD